MAVPAPVPGLVIRYSYLWLDEHALGREEGIKTRPCAIILTKRTEDGEEIVTVLPITHSFPKEERFAIEIPAATKVRLGLDDQRSWIVLNEANQFVWPGPDLRPPVGRDVSSIAYGLLPSGFFAEVRRRLIALLKEQNFTTVPRTE